MSDLLAPLCPIDLGRRRLLRVSRVIQGRRVLLVDDVLLQAEQVDELGECVVLDKQALCLVRVERLEGFLARVLLLLSSLLNVESVEHGVPDEIAVREVVQHGVAKHLKLLVAERQPERLFETSVRQRFDEQVLVLELIAEYVLNWSAD